MRYDDNHNKLNKQKSIVIAALCSFAAIILILCLVFAANYDEIRRRMNNDETFVSTDSTLTSTVKDGNSNENLTVDELSFFKDKDEDNSTQEDSQISENLEEELPIEATDGKHTAVTKKDGTIEWIPISAYLKKHDYNLLNIGNSSGKMKYFVDNTCVSTLGVFVSDEMDEIDFARVKESGISFVMIRAGSRGDLGKVTQDKKLEEYVRSATEAGLNVGLYFSSQAITEKEAKADATAIINAVSAFTITYPIAYVMEFDEDELGRNVGLTRGELTKIVKAFCNTVNDKGFNPMIYGDKAYLLKSLDLSKLSDFEVLLSQTYVDTPDYPYDFAMWNYTNEGKVDGISQDVTVVMSFKDYALK